MINPHSEEELRQALEEMLQCAQAYLENKAGVIETARRLSRYQRTVFSELDDILIFFVGVDSETDEFPLGDARKFWNTEALKREDARRTAAEDLWRGPMMTECQNLIERAFPMLNDLQSGRGWRTK